MKTGSHTKYHIILSLISPVLAAYTAISGSQWPVRRPVLIWLIVMFGATIILQTSDGATFMQMVYDHYIGLSFSQWWFELERMLMFQPAPGTKGDVFVHILSYLTGSLLGVPEIYFVFVSFVYAYFYVKSLSEILRWKGAPVSWLFWALIFVFITYRFIDNLQTVRTWTGAWILFYGTFRYHQTRKRKYLWLMLLAPAFHYAYFLIVLPAYAVIFIRSLSPKLFIAVYIASFFISIDPSGIIGRLQTTELGQSKVKSYYRENPEDRVGKLESGTGNWYARYGKQWSLPKAPNFLAFSLILFGLYSRKKMTSLERGLFSTGLLMVSMANIGDFIGPFYSRTSINGGIYITATTVLLLIRGELLRAGGYRLLFRKLALWVSIMAFAPYLVYVLANIIQFTSMFMLAFPVLGLIEAWNLSIRELIGILFL